MAHLWLGNHKNLSFFIVPFTYSCFTVFQVIWLHMPLIIMIHCWVISLYSSAYPAKPDGFSGYYYVIMCQINQINYFLILNPFSRFKPIAQLIFFLNIRKFSPIIVYNQYYHSCLISTFILLFHIVVMS